MRHRESVQSQVDNYFSTAAIPLLNIQGRVKWWEIVMDETLRVSSMTISHHLTNFTIEESPNAFMMQLNNAIERFDNSSQLLFALKYWGHWTGHDDIQRTWWDLIIVSSRWKGDLTGTWSFSCMIKSVKYFPYSGVSPWSRVIDTLQIFFSLGWTTEANASLYHKHHHEL